MLLRLEKRVGVVDLGEGEAGLPEKASIMRRTRFSSRGKINQAQATEDIIS